MSAIGPGSLLLCIRGATANPAYALVEGRVYECESISPAFACSACAAEETLDLVGHVSDWAGYCACRFVPAGRKGDFETLLRKADQPAESDLEEVH